MAKKEVSFIIKAEDKTKAAFKSIKSSVGNITKSFATVGALAGAAGAAGFGVLVKASSDLQESTAKFETVFANLTPKADEWVKTLQKGYAMSKTESQNALSGFQDLLVPMGMAADQASEMSYAATKLAADLGSFNNMPTEKVIEDITSALTGSAETMKKYGVMINAASIEQEVLNQGWADSKENITEAMKAQAAFNLILQMTTAAQGDMLRTGDSFANQWKSFKSLFQDVLAELGDVLLPSATKALKDFREYWDENSWAIMNNMKAILLVGIDFKNWIWDFTKAAVAGFGEFADAIKLAWDFWSDFYNDIKGKWEKFKGWWDKINRHGHDTTPAAGPAATPEGSFDLTPIDPGGFLNPRQNVFPDIGAGASGRGVGRVTRSDGSTIYVDNNSAVTVTDDFSGRVASDVLPGIGDLHKDSGKLKNTGDNNDLYGSGA